MSEWVKARGEAKKEFKMMDKLVEGYGYAEPKHAEVTDKHFRRLLADEINKSRDFLFPMIEAAYIESNMDNAGALEEVMQWLDVFLLELGLPLVYNEKAGYREFARLIKSDSGLIENGETLAGVIKKMQDEVLHGRSGPVVRKCAQLKNYLTEMLTLFKRRRHSLAGG
jgi:hypothetical protein